MFCGIIWAQQENKIKHDVKEIGERNIIDVISMILNCNERYNVEWWVTTLTEVYNK